MLKWISATTLALLVPASSPAYASLFRAATQTRPLAVAAAASPTGYGAAVLAESTGLVAFWPLYEASGATAADVSGNGYTLTYGAGATLNQTSLVTDGEAKSIQMLSGDTGNAERADTDALDIGAAGTIMFWYKREAGCTSLAGAYSRDDGSGTDRWLCYFSAGASDVLNVFSNGTNVGASGVTNGTHLFAVTWSGTTIRMYADGNEIYNNTTFVAPTASTAAVIAGHMFRGGSNESGCNTDRMQGMAVWNVIKTEAQLDAIWTAAQ